MELDENTLLLSGSIVDAFNCDPNDSSDEFIAVVNNNAQRRLACNFRTVQISGDNIGRLMH